MKTGIHTKKFRVPPGVNVKLKDGPTRVKSYYQSEKRYTQLLEEHVDELSSLQCLHFASNRDALRWIFRGIDSAGKDGVIRYVTSGVNQQGSQVFSPQQPSSEQLDISLSEASREVIP